jgi:hypothetical protein
MPNTTMLTTHSMMTAAMLRRMMYINMTLSPDFP